MPTKQCPYCAEEIKEAAVVCKHCSMHLETGLHISISADTDDLNSEIAAADKIKKPKRRFWSIPIIILIGIGIGLAVINNDGCNKRTVRPYIEESDRLYDDFFEVLDVASAMPRDALDTQILQMQSIRREAAALEHPECADDAQMALLDYFDTVIEAFTLFRTSQPDTVVTDKIREARGLSYQYVLETTELGDEVGLPIVPEIME